MIPRRARNAYAAPAWAGEQRVGDVGTKATLLTLANYADECFSCYPSQETIADETEQSVSTVYRQLKRLTELGLIAREKRYDARGKRTSDRFFLNLDVRVNACETIPGQDKSLQVNLTGSSSNPDSADGGEDAGARSAGLDVTLTGSENGADYRSADPPTTGHSYDRETPRTPSSTRSPVLRSSTGANAASATAAGGAPKAKRSRTVRTPEQQAIFDQAQADAVTWWEYRKANGVVLGDSFIALRNLLEKALTAGATTEQNRAALRTCACTVPTTAQFERALRGEQRSYGGAAPAHRPYQDLPDSMYGLQRA